VYGTVSRKADLLKYFTDFQKLKYKLLEDKLKSVNILTIGSSKTEERRHYTLPNFTLRDLEL
jgi:hypothetical protein